MSSPRAESLPVFCRFRRPLHEQMPSTEPEKTIWIEGWLDEPKMYRRSKICDAFREGGAKGWVSQIVSEWKLDDLSLVELAELLGISIAQASRLRNHFSTSLGVLGQYAASQGRKLPPPNYYRWSIQGLSAALQLTEWLTHTTATRSNTTAIRSNRIPLPKQAAQHDVHLLVAMFVGGLDDVWDHLTLRYESDLYQAADDAMFKSFLVKFAAAYAWQMKQAGSPLCRHSIYFPHGALTEDSRWKLCHDIDQMWRSLDRYAHRAWAAVNGLTIWFILAIADDEEAA